MKKTALLRSVIAAWIISTGCAGESVVYNAAPSDITPGEEPDAPSEPEAAEPDAAPVDDHQRCLAVCQALAACDELVAACGAEFAQDYADGCDDGCRDPQTMADTLAREGLSCSVLVPALVRQTPWSEDCDAGVFSPDPEPEPEPEERRLVVGECAEFMACGGDPIGQWTIDDFCLDIPNNAPPQDPLPECEGDSLNFVINRITGTMSIDEDGTYIQEVVIANNIEFVVPLACLNGLDCERYEVLVNEESMSPTTCPQIDEACHCVSEEQTQAQEPTTGTWSIRDGSVTLVSDKPEDGPIQLQICSEGDKLDMAVGSPDGDFYYHLDMVRRLE